MASSRHLVLRSYGGENHKNTPPWYSETLAMTSFVRAVAEVPEAEVAARELPQASYFSLCGGRPDYSDPGVKEYPVISPDRDWVTEALSVAEWARSQGLDPAASAIEQRCQGLGRAS